MQITITTRHFDADERTKKYLSDKIEKLEKYFSQIISVKATLIKEGYRHMVEIALSAKDMQLVAKESEQDLHAAIDLALHKLEKQLMKFRDKVKEHKGRKFAEEEKQQSIEKLRKEEE